MYLIKEQNVDCGNKANNLFKLQQSGINVPKFAVYGFDIFKDSNFNIITNDKHNFQAFKDYIIQSIYEEVDHLILEDSNKAFAIRSSTTFEDSENFSFAGQFVTKLNISGINNIKDAIVECAKALYNDNVYTYCQENGLDITQLRLFVIIQEYIEAECSGIYFSANPLGCFNQELVTLGYGCGSDIVEDRIPTSTMYRFIDSNLVWYDHQLNTPDVEIDLLNQLSEIKAQITFFDNQFVDIEFCLKGTKLYILQVRPITTLKEDSIHIFDNSNLVESYPGTITPLTIDFVTQAYQNIFISLIKRLLEKDIDSESSILELTESMVYDVNNHLYYDLTKWYYLLQLLPFKKHIIPIWQEMLGIEDQFVPKNSYHIKPWIKIKACFRLFKELYHVPRAMKQLNEEFKEINDYYNQQIGENLSIKELQELYLLLQEQILNNWDITLLNDLYAFLFVGLLNKLAQGYEVNELIGNISSIESMKPLYALKNLSSLFLNNEYKQEVSKLMQLNDEQLRSYINEQQTLVAKELYNFINLYGNRVPEELKLETKTYATNPTLLINKIKSFTLHTDTNIQSIKLKGIKAWVQKRAQTGIELREQSRLNRTQIFGMVRTIFLLAGKKLFEQNMIDDIEDVFFLNINEIFNQEGNLKDKVKKRQLIFKANQQIQLPRRILWDNDYCNFPVIADNFVLSKQNVISGIGCSPGIVTAPVVIVDDINKDIDVSGKIVITKMTDPGWVYLLIKCSGIIAQQGSILSHTAIISRELHIPAIVNVNNAIDIFKTGDIVTMDGTTGTIEVEND